MQILGKNVHLLGSLTVMVFEKIKENVEDDMDFTGQFSG